MRTGLNMRTDGSEILIPGSLYRITKNKMLFYQSEYGEFKDDYIHEHARIISSEINDLIMFIKTNSKDFDYFVFDGKVVCNKGYSHSYIGLKNYVKF
jgi:hypothetical protein